MGMGLKPILLARNFRLYSRANRNRSTIREAGQSFTHIYSNNSLVKSGTKPHYSRYHID